MPRFIPYRTLFRPALAGLALLAASAAAVAPASSQPVPPQRCAAHDDLRDFLSSRYKEQPKSIGVIGEAAVIEVFVAESGTWTILVTRANGNSCIVAAGHSWEDIPIVLGQAT
ncbi:hypothetical protein [Oricola cellulosilytica]|uniref:Uncharacterized protein n=1 Tax=Oricola cellulosilytica TaxID=1429082 RepID=A0A4R0P284_9HYPH|nr:hypothetical protein [Oricola cellulosilytica]TCD10941.1 hypothetical protein E0D97_17745 [Oricola cellulosilytica]